MTSSSSRIRRSTLTSRRAHFRPHRLVQRYNGRVGRASKTRRAGADGIGDVARRQMLIMFLDHPGVGMADDAK